MISRQLDGKIDAWLTVLETSFVAFRLQPYYQNFSKRVVSTPKVYFYDVGLAAYLLGIRTEAELDLHFAKGTLFENLVINELQKNVLNKGQQPRFYFWRDHSHHVVDLLIQDGIQLKAVEIKSGKTIQPDFFKGLNQFEKIAPEAQKILVHGGDEFQRRSQALVFPMGQLGEVV